jgi:hypothetical protein
VEESSVFGFVAGCDAAGDFFAGAFAGGTLEGGGVCCPQAAPVKINASKNRRNCIRHRIGGNCNSKSVGMAGKTLPARHEE